MFLFPAIDLREGQVVRLHQGDYAQQTTYHADPLAQAQQFEKAGASWLHLVDLDGARSGRMTHLEIIERICANTKLKVEVGGGVRSEETIDKLLAVGVTRVVLGTAALKNWAWFENLMTHPAYRGRLVLGLDAREGKLAVSGWEQATSATALEVAQRVTDWPLAAIVYTDIATDGMLEGPNFSELQKMLSLLECNLIASGGVSCPDDLFKLSKMHGLYGAIIGKALYDGHITGNLREIIGH